MKSNMRMKKTRRRRNFRFEMQNMKQTMEKATKTEMSSLKKS